VTWIERLFHQALTIEHRDPSVPDVYGNPTTVTSSTTTVLGYLEPATAVEILVGRETYLSDHKAFLSPGTVVDPGDRIVYQGETYEIVGPPARWFNPFRGVEDHVELLLRKTS
jgi:hypothetical protein